MVAYSSPCRAARARATARSVHSVPMIFIAVVLTVCGTDLIARAAGPGQWTQPGQPGDDWSGGNSLKYAVHMVLVPGDGNPYHSRVLYWRGATPTRFDGGEWGWRTGNDGCAAFPSSSFDNLGLGTSGLDIFCSGNTLLPDGRVFVPGGHDPVTGSYGEKRSRIYARGSGSAAGTWSDGTDMSQWRWYPTATALRDGRVMVAGGDTYAHHRMFGGRHDGAIPSGTDGDLVYRFAPVAGGKWDAAVIPNQDPINGKPGWREGHTFIEMDGASGFLDPSSRYFQVLFGGRSTNGSPKNDTWFPNPGREYNRSRLHIPVDKRSGERCPE